VHAVPEALGVPAAQQSDVSGEPAEQHGVVSAWRVMAPVTGLHASAVQALPSSMFTGVWRHCPPEYESTVQAFVSIAQRHEQAPQNPLVEQVWVA
jgi:hypothetical protein